MYTEALKTAAARFAKEPTLRLPASWTVSVPPLEPLEYDWAPVPRIAPAAWLLFFGLFLYQLARGALRMTLLVLIEAVAGLNGVSR